MRRSNDPNKELKAARLSMKALRFILAPLAAAYGFGAYCRLQAYGQRLLKRYRAQTTVISIGNITCGGTGKTPITIDIALRLVSAGYKPAVLSRGYKRKSADRYLVVSDGKSLLTSLKDAGDEPYLIASKVPGAVVIVGTQRKVTARIAVDEFACNVIILDDGFQHIALERDSDIVLIDYFDDIDQDSLLPTGRLREPASALGRADSVLITKVPAHANQNRLNKLGAFTHHYSPKATIGLVSFLPDYFYSISVAETRNEEWLGAVPESLSKSDNSDVFANPISTISKMSVYQMKGRRVLAFCGLARPEYFFTTLDEIGLELAATSVFADHHWYTASDLDKLIEEAEDARADFLLTTEKDLIKLTHLVTNSPKPVFALVLKPHFVGSLPPLLMQLIEEPTFGGTTNALSLKSSSSLTKESVCPQ
jgi:tetraacyldisaccharide 4'-kinase